MEPPLEYMFPDAGAVPNNPVLPLLYYKEFLAPEKAEEMAEEFERLFDANQWPPEWRDGIYPFSHFHSNAHEALGVYRGTATLRLGHDTGVTLDVKAGDLIVIPAGVGHWNLGSTPDFGVVGAYPAGQSADLLRAGEGDRREVRDSIAKVPLPVGGHLTSAWRI